MYTLQSSDLGAAPEPGPARPGRHQMGHSFVPPGGLRDLLLLPVERNFDVRQSGVVHGSVPLRRSPDPPSEGRHSARLRGGHQVLSEPQFQRHRIRRSKLF